MLLAGRQNRLLHQFAQTVAWRVGTECPCRDSYSGAAAPDCSACGGVGVIWDPAQTTEAALASVKVQQQWAQFGSYMQGDVVLSIAEDQALYAIGRFDRVVLSQSSEPFRRILTYTGAETVSPTVYEVTRAEWLDANSAVVSASAMPSVNADGTLSWSGSTPPANTQYTLSGRKRPEYFCYQDFPQDRHHQHGTPLPRRVVLREFDLFGREEP